MPGGLAAQGELFVLVDSSRDRPLAMQRLLSAMNITQLTIDQPSTDHCWSEGCLQNAMASKPEMKAKYPYL